MACDRTTQQSRLTSNGTTAAVNGIIEPHPRIARGVRSPADYQLGMVLAPERVTHPNLR